MELKTFPGPENAPPYAILSHTWNFGNENSKPFEILFEEWNFQLRQEFLKFVDPDPEAPVMMRIKPKKAAQKILAFCQKALSFGLPYDWIDTLCIDKNVSSDAFPEPCAPCLIMVLRNPTCLDLSHLPSFPKRSTPCGNTIRGYRLLGLSIGRFMRRPV